VTARFTARPARDGAWPAEAALVVLAKAPAAGHSKTRLCPPCHPEQAAALAEGALSDTLTAALATPARRHVLVLDGEPGAWLPPSMSLLAQRGDGLAARLSAAFDDVAEPALLIGMDTPQVTAPLLAQALKALCDPRHDAVLGLTADGGYWAIGLRRADPRVFAGVPMSSPVTGRVQRERLRELGLRTADLPPLRDVDSFADAQHVGARLSGGHFAQALALVQSQLSAGV